ncbi:hypothetical protein TWF281_003760 [Arthrobotrys megalospora]
MSLDKDRKQLISGFPRRLHGDIYHDHAEPKLYPRKHSGIPRTAPQEIETVGNSRLALGIDGNSALAKADTQKKPGTEIPVGEESLDTEVEAGVPSSTSPRSFDTGSTVHGGQVIVGKIPSMNSRGDFVIHIPEDDTSISKPLKDYAPETLDRPFPSAHDQPQLGKVSPVYPPQSSTPWNMHYRLRSASRLQRPWTNFANDGKLFLEESLKQPISFWPFSEPQQRCAGARSRFYWDCACGKEISVDLPLFQPAAGSVHRSEDKDQPTLANQLVSHPSSPTTSSPLLSGVKGRLHDYGAAGPSENPESNIKSLPLGLNRAQLSHTREAVRLNNSANLRPPSGSRQHSKVSTSKAGGDDSITMGTIAPPTSPGGTGISENFEIFFVVRCIDGRTVMKVIPMNKSQNDKILFEKLCHAYILVRGWRRWLSFTSICDIQWVKFKRYEGKLVANSDGVCSYISESLPDQSNKNYETVHREPPIPIIRPLDRQHVMDCFRRPEELSCSDSLKYSVPKWVGAQSDETPEKWGLYAVEGVSIFKIIILGLVVNSIPILAFAPWWLVSHPGDLQNAFIPSVAVTTFYFWVVGIYIACKMGSSKT